MNKQEMLDHYGPWAIIAGGSEGIGSALAQRLAEMGFKLVLIARKPAALEQTAQTVRETSGTEVLTLSADLTAPDAVDRICEVTGDRDVGLLLYNAGAESTARNFLDRPFEDTERMVMLNVLTPARLIHRFGDAMRKRGKGGIVLCSSLASLAGTPGLAAYSGVKAFENLLAETLWAELGADGVDVLSAILPLVRTPAAERMGLDFDNEQQGVEPDVIADELLGNIRNGPALHPGGSEEMSMQLRAMARDDAVRFLINLSESVNAVPQET